MTGVALTSRAIVFAYHDVGVRCLRVLLNAGVEVPLVVTHTDQSSETIWFNSVAALATDYGLRCVTPEDPHLPELLAEARAAQPDFLFSFYYRHMLRADWLGLPSRGAFNMHGSLLPQFRGRAPVNWAILRGARETGATLHRMNEKPDSGAIVDQCAVPILTDDTARDVLVKVAVAAEIVLARSLPRLVDDSAVERAQDLSQGAYFGRRTTQDGRLPVDATAQQAHDFVRALAPPYPGAFVIVGGHKVMIEKTRHALPLRGAPGQGLRLVSDGGQLWLVTADGGTLRVLAARIGESGKELNAHGFEAFFERRCVAAER